MTPLRAFIHLVVLLATPAEWESWVRLLLAVSVPLLFVTGGLFVIGRKLASMADEAFEEQWQRRCGSQAFRDLVNGIRKPAETEFSFRTEDMMDVKIREHNASDDSHRPALRHHMRNVEATISAIREVLDRRADRMEARIDHLEERRS